MVEINPPFALQNRTDHTAAGDRSAMTSLVKSPGRSRINDLLITQNATPNMSVLVTEGSCWVSGSAAGQGYYHCRATGTTTLAVTSAHATLSRVDLVIAEVLDAFYSGSSNLWRLRVVAGTAGTGSPPAVPVNSVRIGTITVPAGASSIINANLSSTAPLADIGTQFVANTTDRGRIMAAEGQCIYQASIFQSLFYSTTYGWQAVSSPMAWTTYVPTLTGVTMGSGGGVSAREVRIGRIIHNQGALVLGTGGSLSPSVAVTLSLLTPASLAYGFYGSIGTVMFTRSGVGYQGGVMRLNSATTMQPVPAHPMNLGLTATVPWTWSANDSFSWDISYEPAS